MISKTSQKLISILCLLFSSVLKASPCTEVINNIQADINKYPNTLQDHHLPWKSLSWLQKHLGQGHRSTISILTQYKWQCPGNSEEYLVVLADQRGQLSSVSGQYSNDQGSGLFSADLGIQNTNDKQYIQVSSQPQPIQVDIKFAADKTLVDQQAIHSFNDWFNVHIETTAQFKIIGEYETISYFRKLRTCTPGVYKYPIVDPMAIYKTDKTKPFEMYSLAVATILGNKDGMCAVDTSLKSRDKTQEIKCNYSSTSLALFADEFAKTYFSEGSLALLRRDPTQQMANECKTVISAQDLVAQDPLRDFLSKFKSCTPGVYTLPRGPGKVVTTISGYKNNKCMLQGVLYLGDTQNTVHCAYSQDSLDFLVNQKIDELNGKSSTQNTTPEYINKIESIFKECDSAWVPF